MYWDGTTVSVEGRTLRRPQRSPPGVARAGRPAGDGSRGHDHPTRPDPAVEAEATMVGAVCVVSPWEYPVDLLVALSRVDGALPA